MRKSTASTCAGAAWSAAWGRCNHWGSAPPPRTESAEPPRSTAALRLPAITGAQRPLHEQSSRSLPAQPRYARVLGFSTPSTGGPGGASPLNGCACACPQLPGFSTPSANEVRGASPLNGFASLALISPAQRPLHEQGSPPLVSLSFDSSTRCANADTFSDG